MSSPRPGLLVGIVIGLPDGAQVTGRFIDDGSVRDLTDFCADLLLDGLMLSAQQSQAATGTPGVDAVPVADLALTVPLGDVLVLLVEHAAGVVTQLPSDGMLDVIAEGIASAVAAAVDEQALDS